MVRSINVFQRRSLPMAFGLMHDGLSTDELLQGTHFKAVLEERMHVWDDIVARISAEGGVGETMIPGPLLRAHLSCTRGVMYIVNRDTCFLNVYVLHGF